MRHSRKNTRSHITNAPVRRITRENICVTLGQHIHELRRKHKLSQQKLAERAGLHRSSVASIERGERDAFWITYARIAKGLGMTPSALLKRAGV